MTTVPSHCREHLLEMLRPDHGCHCVVIVSASANIHIIVSLVLAEPASQLLPLRQPGRLNGGHRQIGRLGQQHVREVGQQSLGGEVQLLLHLHEGLGLLLERVERLLGLEPRLREQDLRFDVGRVLDLSRLLPRLEEFRVG